MEQAAEKTEAWRSNVSPRSLASSDGNTDVMEAVLKVPDATYIVLF